MPVSRNRPWRRRALSPLLLLAAALLCAEEWLWTHTAQVLRRLARWPALARCEAWIRARSPAQAVALFALPLALIAASKVVIVWALTRHHGSVAIALIVSDKIVGTALCARLWQLSEPALVQYTFLRRARDVFLRLRGALYGWLAAQRWLRAARARWQRSMRQLRATWQTWRTRYGPTRNRRRWRAMVRLQRRRGWGAPAA